jgi:hypothetical protein
VKKDMRISTHAIWIIESVLGTYVEKCRVRRQDGRFVRGGKAVLTAVQEG